jgi:trimeric autotransporter adhesin
MRKCFSKKCSLLVLTPGLCMLAVGLRAPAQSFTVPAAATSSQTMVETSLSATVSLAVDASGNLFYSQPNVQTLVEQPANGGATITLYTEANPGTFPKGVATNGTYAYITDYSGHLWQVPVGGGAATDVLANCSSLDNGYLGTQEVATDGQGNVYTAGNNETTLFKITPAGVCSIVNGVTLDANSNVAVDAAGDFAYTLGGALYSLPVNANKPVAVAGTFNTIIGLRADASGNVFVSTDSGIVEVPFINGTLAGASAFTVLGSNSQEDVAVGVDGTIYTTDGTNIFKNLIGNVQFRTSVVGSAAGTQTVNVVFNTAETLTGIRYASGTGTSTEITNAGTGSCALNTSTPYAVGGSCTINLTFMPSALGSQDGAVVLSAASGTVGNVSVGARGSGPGLVVDPGTQAALGSDWQTPAGIAVDATGAVFATDSAAGTVSYLAAGSSTAATIATGLSQPSGITVAADGSVYVANTGANTVVEIPYTASGFGTAFVVVSGLNAPSGLVFGQDGSLYIANKDAGTVLRVPNQAGSLNYYDQVAVGSGFTAPSGLAVDGNGNIYVADSGAGSITEISGAATSVIVSGLNAPGSLALDDSGSLYVVQSDAATVLRIAYSGGSYNTNATTSLGSGFARLSGVAADSAGNLYVADATGATVDRIERTSGLLNFGNVNAGSSSAAQSLTLSNDGDTALTFGAMLDSTSGNTGDFAVSSPASNACVGGRSLAAGGGCDISGVFTPTTTGTRTETFALNSNAVNAPAVNGSLTGVGTDLPLTTLAVKTSPTGTVSYGTAVAITATVSLPTGSTVTPTGAVTFLVNGTTYATVNLVNGSASTSITGLPAQSNTIGATYSGDDNYAGSTAAAVTVVVTLAPTTTSLVSTVSSTTPVPPGTSVTLTANVSASVSSSKPTGTVNFVSNGTTLATAVVNNSTGVASVTTSTLPAGTYAVTAFYSGDSGFAASSSGSIMISILAPQYVVSNFPTALTVSSPGSVSATIGIQPISGYVGGVDMACSGLPANTQCAFVPATVAFTGTNTAVQNVTVTITTDQAPASTVALLLLPFSGFLILGAWRQRKVLVRGVLPTIALFLLCGIGLLSLSGCGSMNLSQTSAGTAKVTITFTGTPNGTTAVPTSGNGNLSETFSFALTVK